MNAQEQQEIDNQLGAYALGALDPEDRFAADALLATSPASREELRQLREVVALLPYAAPAVEPPDRLRQRLMARVAASDTRTEAPTTLAPSPARPRRAWAMPAIAAVLAIALLGLAGLSWSLNSAVARLDDKNRALVTTLDDLQAALADTRTRQDELEAQLAAGQNELAEVRAALQSSEERIGQLNAEIARDDYVISFVSAPGVATRQLAPAEATTSARGEMYMYPGNSSAVVLFSGLPPLAPGQVYQFWLADGSTQVAGATFVADSSGIGHIVVQAPREVNAFRQVMVTVEPEGGSSSPSENVVLAGSL
jgi:anti-sigma-K factor RskA